MPFKSVSELPADVRKLPAKQQRQWLEIFTSAWERYDPKKDKGHDPKKGLAENREAFAFRVANGVVFGKRTEDLAAVLPADVPLASALGRGVLPWRLIEAFHTPGEDRRRRTRKRMGEALGEALQGRGSVADVVEAALDEALHDHTFSEITRAVTQAVRAKFNANGDRDAWPMEFFLGKVIVHANGKLFEVPYELDGETGEATLGKGREVRVRFVPAGTP